MWHTHTHTNTHTHHIWAAGPPHLSMLELLIFPEDLLIAVADFSYSKSWTPCKRRVGVLNTCIGMRGKRIARELMGLHMSERVRKHVESMHRLSLSLSLSLHRYLWGLMKQYETIWNIMKHCETCQFESALPQLQYKGSCRKWSNQTHQCQMHQQNVAKRQNIVI